MTDLRQNCSMQTHLARSAGLLAVVAAFAAAGCGSSSSSSPPATAATTTPATSTVVTTHTAVQTGIRVKPTQVVFLFRTPPQLSHAGYMPKARIIQSTTGRPVEILGRATLVVRFKPASSLVVVQGRVRTVFGQKRRPLPHTNEFVREAVRTQNTGAVLVWVIGLTRQRPYRIATEGATVTVTFS